MKWLVELLDGPWDGQSRWVNGTSQGPEPEWIRAKDPMRFQVYWYKREQRYDGEFYYYVAVVT